MIFSTLICVAYIGFKLNVNELVISAILCAIGRKINVAVQTQ